MTEEDLKVYEVINCLNKNLIPHFVWYLEKGKRYDIETVSIDRIWNKKHFCESCRKFTSKVSPIPLCSFGKKLKTAIAYKESFKNKIFKKSYQKDIKKL